MIQVATATSENLNSNEVMATLKSAVVDLENPKPGALKPLPSKERFFEFKNMAKQKANRDKFIEEQKQKVEAAVVEPIKRSVLIIILLLYLTIYLLAMWMLYPNS